MRHFIKIPHICRNIYKNYSETEATHATHAAGAKVDSG